MLSVLTFVPFISVLLVLLFLLFSLYSHPANSSSSSASPPTLSEGLDWLSGIPTTTRDRNCEVCQVLSLLLSDKLRDKLPASHPRSAKNTQKQQHKQESSANDKDALSGRMLAAERASRGSVDVIASELLEAEEACGFGDWKNYADKTEELFVHDMTATCKVMLEENAEALENFLPKVFSPRELSEKVCVGPEFAYCGDGKGEEQQNGKGLWKAGDWPDERESKEDRNARISESFLSYNKKQPGVVVTSTGLQYKKITTASSPLPSSPARPDGPLCPSSLDANVKVHYVGRLLNNKEFDSSFKRGEPAEFGLSQVVAGWGEGLQLMCEGDQMEFFLPASIGYGTTGAGKDIGGNMALKFYVHLVEVVNGGETREEIERKKKQEGGEKESVDGKVMGEEEKEEL
eukprot:GHVS01018779.1.p1 GENE.GHVS01018779.1~~GHVS01018779.1.p1  ORF type:complete len:403 (-),score=99.65 GHVS01018779.1:109-1317(-)